MKRIFYPIGLKKIFVSLVKRKSVVEKRFFETVDMSILKMSNISDLKISNSDGKWRSIAKYFQQFVSTANPLRGLRKATGGVYGCGNEHRNGNGEGADNERGTIDNN